MVRQFNERFGEDDDDLLAWQTLCYKVNILVPDDVTECKALSRTHVNLVDLTQMERDDAPPTKFRTVKELSDYSKSTGNIFPRDHSWESAQDPSSPDQQSAAVVRYF